LKELKVMLSLLNERKARAWVFFRQCTLPSREILDLIQQGPHEIGLHLENSRSFATFTREKEVLQQHVGRAVRAVSKHGSGGKKFGRRHYAPYEPQKYVDWARHCGMRAFFGNLEDPTIEADLPDPGFAFFPAAFWLEPSWRDATKFTIPWLLSQAKVKDTVLLVHPENVLESPELTKSFEQVVSTLETKTLL